MLTQLITPRATQLITEVRAALSGTRHPGPAVARALAGHLWHDDLLTAEQCEPAEAGYRQHVVHVEPNGTFSIVAVVWLPGQRTPVHDHVSWCVVGTYRGVEEETTYHVEEGFLVPTAVTVAPRGTTTFLSPPGDIHAVRNPLEELAISVHIYGADIGALGSSIRRLYDHLPIATP
ncbi:cysteine dioxygenase family protein [Longispora albida]|uniref:cysteine dioxygenase family protein n=1 Tax=Longispora albida TaxID=203523 RepID=UPI00036D26AB|nr:cysteine dioxygenase family protein [Longispora albida]